MVEKYFQNDVTDLKNDDEGEACAEDVPVRGCVVVLVFRAWWMPEVLVPTKPEVLTLVLTTQNMWLFKAPALGDVSESVVSNAGIGHALRLEVTDVENRQTPFVVTGKTAFAVLPAQLVHHLRYVLRRPPDDEGLTSQKQSKYTDYQGDKITVEDVITLERTAMKEMPCKILNQIPNIKKHIFTFVRQETH